MTYDISQPIDFNEAIACKRHIAMHREMISRLLKRVQGLHLDDVAEPLDDALSYLSDADDAIQRALDNPRDGIDYGDAA